VSREQILHVDVPPGFVRLDSKGVNREEVQYRVLSNSLPDACPAPVGPKVGNRAASPPSRSGCFKGPDSSLWRAVASPHLPGRASDRTLHLL